MESRSFKESIWALNPEQIGDPTRCVQGRVQFEQGKWISINLPFGQLLSRVPDSNGAIDYSVDSVSTADTVYGFSQDGRIQTLVDITDASTGNAWLGTSRQVLRGSKMYVAKEAEPILPNPAISSSSLRMVGLREWVGLSPISETFRYDDDGVVKEHVVSYSKGGALLIVLHDGQVVSIVLNPMYIIRGGKYPTAYFKHAVDSDYSLDFTFAGVVALGDAFDKGIVDDFLYILQRIAARQPVLVRGHPPQRLRDPAGPEPRQPRVERGHEPLGGHPGPVACVEELLLEQAEESPTQARSSGSFTSAESGDVPTAHPAGRPSWQSTTAFR